MKSGKPSPIGPNVLQGGFVKARSESQGGPVRGTVVLAEPGLLQVSCQGLGALPCDVLQSHQPAVFAPGDEVLVMVLSGDAPRGVVMGRVVAYSHEPNPGHLALAATESLTLRCGESSLEMRADGQVLLRGDDVVLRAKGTQRIRAGTVAIN